MLVVILSVLDGSASSSCRDWLYNYELEWDLSLCYHAITGRISVRHDFTWFSIFFPFFSIFFFLILMILRSLSPESKYTFKGFLFLKSLFFAISTGPPQFGPLIAFLCLGDESG